MSKFVIEAHNNYSTGMVYMMLVEAGTAEEAEKLVVEAVYNGPQGHPEDSEVVTGIWQKEYGDDRGTEIQYTDPVIEEFEADGRHVVIFNERVRGGSAGKGYQAYIKTESDSWFVSAPTIEEARAAAASPKPAWA